jgi:hypothetical protein
MPQVSSDLVHVAATVLPPVGRWDHQTRVATRSVAARSRHNIRRLIFRPPAWIRLGQRCRQPSPHPRRADHRTVLISKTDPPVSAHPETGVPIRLSATAVATGNKRPVTVSRRRRGALALSAEKSFTTSRGALQRPRKFEIDTRVRRQLSQLSSMPPTFQNGEPAGRDLRRKTLAIRGISRASDFLSRVSGERSLAAHLWVGVSENRLRRVPGKDSPRTFFEESAVFAADMCRK